MNVRELLKWVIPDPEDCRRSAQELRLADPNFAPAEVARKAVTHAGKWGASVGAATGVTGSPITMAQAAFADAIAMLKIEGKMAGTIAALLDPESLDDPEIFEKEILRIVFPAAFSQALRKMGVRAGEEAAKSLIRRYATGTVTKAAAEQAAKRFGVRLTQKAVASKAIPLVGAGIGAAWNWVEIQAIGQRALLYHTDGLLPEQKITTNVKTWLRTNTPKLRHPFRPRPKRDETE